MRIFLITCFTLSLLSSCKKEYACECTTTGGSITEIHEGSSAENACAEATSVLDGKVCTVQ